MQTKFKARLIHTFNYELQRLLLDITALLLIMKRIIINNIVNIKDNYNAC